MFLIQRVLYREHYILVGASSDDSLMPIKLTKKIRAEAPPTPKRSLNEIMESARARFDAAKLKRMEKQRSSGKIPMNDLVGVWVRTCREYFPNSIPVMTKVDGIILKQTAERLHAMEPKLDFQDLMVWSISRWAAIMSEHFRKMTNHPTEPAVRFWVKCVGTFLAIKEKEGFDGTLGNMTAKEQMIAKLMRSGKSLETATREVEERMGLTKLRDEIKSERQKLQQLQLNQARAKEIQERLDLMERKPTKPKSATTEGTYEQWK